jgi:hypothetical protein
VREAQNSVSYSVTKLNSDRLVNLRFILGVIVAGLVWFGLEGATSSLFAVASPAEVGADIARPRFLYAKESLVMTADAVRDANGAFSLAQLATPQPKCKVVLKAGVTPLVERLWKIALDDAEHNLVTTESGAVYFGAGNKYGVRIYERDIAVSGVLGLNRLYPEVMLSSLKVARETRKQLGYKVSAPHVVREIDAPWEVIAQVDKEVMAKYRTNSYTRRTDDVAWLWAADDLFTLHPELADWNWMVENGEHFFRVFYSPWLDRSDGLYRGQPLFHDIQSSAYPKGMSVADCVLLKALSTNCLYYRGMLAMARACEKAGRPHAETQQWLERAAALKAAIQTEFIQSDGTLAYYKDRNGQRMPNRSGYATAFAVIFGIVEGDAAKAAYAAFPTPDNGIPLFFPFIADTSGSGWHNHASWPFCDTFFLWGKSIADGKDYTDYNAALLARSLGTAIKRKGAKPGQEEADGFGSFHEYVTLPDGFIGGSGRQLWSAAAFINVCIRAGLLEDKPGKVRPGERVGAGGTNPKGRSNLSSAECVWTGENISQRAL